MSEIKYTQHTISLLVNNRPGVLIRIALVFSRRGYNIDSVVVSPGKNSKFSRMSLVASGDPVAIDQIIKQLNKLVDVLHAIDHIRENLVEKELGLYKIQCSVERQEEILQIANHFKANTVDMAEDTVILQVTGTSEDLNTFHLMMNKFGVIESIRSGKIFMVRGRDTT